MSCLSLGGGCERFAAPIIDIMPGRLFNVQ
jgi:hypothetical protein